MLARVQVLGYNAGTMKEDQSPQLELNPLFAQALDLIENTRESVFVTGRAGTGKSTLLRHWRLHTKKKMAVLAPTGVAAVNVGGQTIHSFFGFKPDITVVKTRRLKPPEDKALFKKLDTLVIDEISMVRADLLDCIDVFLRRFGPDKFQPFGGVQMVFIGDLYQLPPIVSRADEDVFAQHYRTPYFFSAHVISPPAQLIEAGEKFRFRVIELDKIYRQSDADFIALLNAVRENTATSAHWQRLNLQFDPNFLGDPSAKAIHLVTTNAMAAEINDEHLAALRGTKAEFVGETSGKFDPKAYPTDEVLCLKIGAQVMLMNNDRQGRWVNGTVGTVVDIGRSEGSHAAPIWVELATGDTVDVFPNKWDMFEFRFDAARSTIDTETVGSFTQYPLRLAWAVTIHKAQGKTFDRVILDIGRGTFAAGQLYVALSRCTSLEGLTLKRPLRPHHVLMDARVAEWLHNHQN